MLVLDFWYKRVVESIPRNRRDFAGAVAFVSAAVAAKSSTGIAGLKASGVNSQVGCASSDVSGERARHQGDLLLRGHIKYARGNHYSPAIGLRLV
jgi:hypothetical protein